MHLCPLVATIYSIAEKSATNRIEAAEMSQETRGDGQPVLSSPRVDKNTGYNSVSTGTATKLTAGCIIPAFTELSMAHIQQSMCTVNFYYLKDIVLQKSSHIH